VAAIVVGEEGDDLAGDGGGVGEGDEDAAVAGEEFGGVPVGGGDDGFAGAEGVGEGAGGDLGLVEVGGDVEVGGADELFEVFEVDEVVVEDDALVDVIGAGEEFEAEAVVFAVVAEFIGVSGAEDDIDDIGEGGLDGGEGVEDVRDALVGGEEAKGEEDDFAFDAELVFEVGGVDEADIGDAVGNEDDFGEGGGVGVEEDLAAAFGHDDEVAGAGEEAVHDAALIGVGLFEDGVEGGDDGHAEFAEEGKDVAAGGAAVDAELVLEADDVDVGDVEEVGGAEVGGEVLLFDLEANDLGVGVAGGEVVDGDGEAIAEGVGGGDGGEDVRGEGSDAALAGEVVSEEGDFADARVIFHEEARVGERRLGMVAGLTGAMRPRE